MHDHTTARRRSGALASRGGAVVGDQVFRLLTLVSGLVILVILALILYTTLTHAWPAFQKEGWSLISDKTWIPNDPDGAEGPLQPRLGLLSFVYGTLIVSLVALVVAVPISIGIALFLTELAPRRVHGIAVTAIDLLAAVPSVVFGFWGVQILGPWIVGGYRATHNVLADVPVLGTLFGPPQSGRAFLTAGIVVAIMITPIITSITREVFSTVPSADKQAALALGATRWEMIRGAVLPHSFGGIVGGVMLGLGRAMGETVAIALLVGAAPQITPNLFGPGHALPAVIMLNWGESAGEFQSALIACGVLLFVVTVIVNYLARTIVRRAEVRLKGA